MPTLLILQDHCRYIMKLNRTFYFFLYQNLCRTSWCDFVTCQKKISQGLKHLCLRSNYNCGIAFKRHVCIVEKDANIGLLVVTWDRVSNLHTKIIEYKH